MAEGLTLGELSRRLGRDKGGLSRLAKKGRIPRNTDGTFDENAVRAAMKATIDPARAKPLIDGVDDVDGSSTINTPEQAREAIALIAQILNEEGQEGLSGFNAARTAETILKVRERDLNLAKKRGELVDSRRAAELIFAKARSERDVWLQWPARVGALMAAELKLDPHQMETVLDAYVRQHLAEITEFRLELR
jgi:hypothetical protein